MSLPTLTQKQPSSQSKSPQNGYNQPILFNCIHCEEEYVEKKESDETDQLFSKLEGIEGIDKKDYRLCQGCVELIITNLQEKITNAQKEITFLQEKKHMVNELIEQSKSKFNQEDFKLLSDTEAQLDQKIAEVEQQKKQINVEVIQMQNEYCKTLKEENQIDDEVLELERQILDLIEQKEMQEKELQQVNDQIKELESQDFLRDQFKISYLPNITINGFILTLPTKENYMDFNQGMGQLCLLFEYLKRQTDYNYKRIRAFECNGAVSKIERSEKLKLDLYCKLSESETPQNKKGNMQKFHIPFESLREFSGELIDFYTYIMGKYQKNVKKENLQKIRKDEFERRSGELQSKQDSKETWDFYFSQILHHFDCILDACSQVV